MASKLANKLTDLRKADFKPWVTILWLVKRRLIEKQAVYSVLRVDTDKKLQAKLKRAITERVQGKEYQLEEYSFVSADQDDHMFTIAAAETDFNKIHTEIDKGLNNKKAETYDELLNSWAYVIELSYHDETVHGLRKINSLTQAKKVKSRVSLIFKDQLLIDLEEERVFTIDTHIDFFVYGGTVFVTNKKEFESALNFRKGMEDNRDAVLKEFGSLGIFDDIEPIRKIVGSNLHLLRKISAIQKSGYYKDKGFISNLIKLNKTENWGLVIKDKQIIVTEENVDLVLTLLNNNRLKSPINQEVFDVPTKKKVGQVGQVA